jgi:catalase
VPDIYEEIVDALNELNGAHAGQRAAHAKGILCAGSFTASSDASHVTRAAHLQADPVRVTVRFSNGSGDPNAPDAPPEGRGMATKFYLADGTTTDIVAITLPVFFVRTATDFLEFVRARKTDPHTGQPDPELIGRFLAGHPETQAAVGLVLPTLTPPTSYAQRAYNSLHAFGFVNDAGERVHGRYRWEPDAGEETLDEQAARDASPNYLQEELRARLEREPVVFTLRLKLAADGDQLDDPTVAWPDDREWVTLGRLELTGLDETRERGDDVLVFDPTRVTDGIELTDDEILRTRHAAYAESVQRRSGVPRPD